VRLGNLLRCRYRFLLVKRLNNQAPEPDRLGQKLLLRDGRHACLGLWRHTCPQEMARNHGPQCGPKAATKLSCPPWKCAANPVCRLAGRGFSCVVEEVARQQHRRADNSIDSFRRARVRRVMCHRFPARRSGTLQSDPLPFDYRFIRWADRRPASGPAARSFLRPARGRNRSRGSPPFRSSLAANTQVFRV
jgi:hypothetical protein